MNIDSRGGLGYTEVRWYIFVPPGGTILLRRLYLVYAFRTILEFLGEKDAQKVAHIWEENGWNVRKWMSEDLYIL